MRKMKFNSIKNFIILGLVIAAVYQTGLLWLGNSAGHNFFYSFLGKDKLASQTKTTPKEAIDPTKIIVGYGNKSFNVTYPGISGNSISSASDSFILGVLNGRFEIKQEDTALESYIDKKCVIYDFAVDISASEYINGLGEETELGISSIGLIISVPAVSNSEKDILYFVDNKNGKTAVVTSENTINEVELLKKIDTFGQENMEKSRYISSVQSGLNIFSDNIFVPQWTQKKVEYYGVEKINSITKIDQNLEMALESVAAEMFDGLSGTSAVKDEQGIYILSNNSLVVKYYPYGVLEYYNYNNKETDKTQSLSTAYYACKEFLKKNKALSSSLYLSDVQLKGNGLVFCFNYSINGFPIILSEDIKNNIKTSYGAEVVVENNVVKKLKIYTYDFETSQEKKGIITTDFVSAMNDAIAMHRQGVNNIENIFLGYYDSYNEDESGLLKWFTYINDSLFIVDSGTKE